MAQVGSGSVGGMSEPMPGTAPAQQHEDPAEPRPPAVEAETETESETEAAAEAEAEPEDDEPRPLGLHVTPTGHAPVDAQLRRLEDADHLAVSGHLEVYEDVHRGLRDTLTALDRPGS